MGEPNQELPAQQELHRLGVSIDRELHAGKQSRVFAATIDGRDVVIKLTDARMADRTVLAERMRTAEELAWRTEAAVAPVRIDGELVHAAGGWLATATPLIVGRQAETSDAADARLLGRTLGGLHEALAALAPRGLPPVAALDADEGSVDNRSQLLHGDFSDQNVIVTSDGLRVFDFDDCGYGPVLYDVANSLYMVLFDAEVNADRDRYAAFRAPFLEGYADVAGEAVDVAVVDSLIDARIHALGRWLDDLSNAPIGIRTSSPEWRRTLRTFVSSQRTTGTTRSR